MCRGLGSLRVITTDRPHEQCDYNLVGLKTGDRCPECGLPIPILGAGAPGWVITDAGVAYLERFGLGAVTMAVSVLMLGFGVVWTLAEFPWGNGYTEEMGVVVALAGLAWACGVWVITQPRPGG